MTIPTDSSRNDWAAYSLKLEGVIGGLSADLATARARIAALTEALRVIATQSVYEDDEYAYQLRDMIDAAREVAQDALAEPGRGDEGMTTTTSDFDVCRCGDYRHQHGPNGGRCRVCGYSSAPYDGCGRFRLFKASLRPRPARHLRGSILRAIKWWWHWVSPESPLGPAAGAMLFVASLVAIAPLVLPPLIKFFSWWWGVWS